MILRLRQGNCSTGGFPETFLTPLKIMVIDPESLWIFIFVWRKWRKNDVSSQILPGNGWDILFCIFFGGGGYQKIGDINLDEADINDTKKLAAGFRQRAGWPNVTVEISMDWVKNQIFLEFSPRSLGKWSNLTSTFLRWVGSTTNQRRMGFYQRIQP